MTGPSTADLMEEFRKADARRRGARTAQRTGAALEGYLEWEHVRLEGERIAVVYKTNPPVRFIGRGRAKRATAVGTAPPDYVGHLVGRTGRGICFDAKASSGPRWSWEAREPRDEIRRRAQVERIVLEGREFGAVAGLLVAFMVPGATPQAVWVPWWNVQGVADGKGRTLAEVMEWGDACPWIVGNTGPRWIHPAKAATATYDAAEAGRP
jgi:hypothetical protein